MAQKWPEMVVKWSFMSDIHFESEFTTTRIPPTPSGHNPPFIRITGCLLPGNPRRKYNPFIQVYNSGKKSNPSIQVNIAG